MKYLFFALGLFLGYVSYAQQVLSPNKKIKVVVEMQSTGQAYFKVLYKSKGAYIEVLPTSPLGISRADEQFVSNLKLVGEGKPVAVNDKYEMLTGKRRLFCENFGTEKTFNYQNASKHPMNITFRVYNDGVAFRYTFPNKSDSTLSITGEAIGYVIPKGKARWMQPFDQSYDQSYPLNTGENDKKNNGEWAYPAL